MSKLAKDILLSSDETSRFDKFVTVQDVLRDCGGNGMHSLKKIGYPYKINMAIRLV